MRKIFFLRAVLELLFYISIIGGIALLVILPIIFTSSDWDIPFKINGLTTQVDSLESKITFIIAIISYFLFVYAIYLFKKTVNLFINKRIFDNQVISNLSKIGKIFIIVTIILNIIEFIFKVTTTQKAEIIVSSGFDSFLFTIAIGLFFIIMSEVFKIAKKLKDENELTI